MLNQKHAFQNCVKREVSVYVCVHGCAYACLVLATSSRGITS